MDNLCDVSRDVDGSGPARQVSPEELQSLEERIRRINQLARFQKAVRAEVPLDFVLGVGGHDLDSVGQDLSRVSGLSREHLRMRVTLARTVLWCL